MEKQHSSKEEHNHGYDDDTENSGRPCRLESVKAGQLIEAELDLVLGNDITSPVAIGEMKKMNTQTVFDKDKIALVMDHFIPNKDIKSAENCKCCREFACRHEISNYFDVGRWALSTLFCRKKVWSWPETR